MDAIQHLIRAVNSGHVRKNEQQLLAEIIEIVVKYAEQEGLQPTAHDRKSK